MRAEPSAPRPAGSEAFPRPRTAEHARSGSGVIWELAATAVLIAAGAIAAALIIGAAGHILFAAWARRQVALTAAGPATPVRWRDVFAHNLAALCGALAAAAFASLRDPRDRDLPRPGRAALVGWQLVCGGFVVWTVAVNVLYVGLAFAGYGTRAAWLLAPHGPLELAAYATALATWVLARKERLPARVGIPAGGVSVAMLAAAAAIEAGLR